MMRHSPLRHAGALLWKRRPLHLTFFVTRRCDARCDFCFSRGRTAAAGPELSTAEIARLAPTVGPLLWLSYSGGEPTLREDLPEITGIFARHCRPVIVLLSTNGLDPRRTADAVAGLLAAAPRSTIVVKLSLDGPPELHDRLRGVPGAHARVLESLGLLRRAGGARAAPGGRRQHRAQRGEPGDRRRGLRRGLAPRRREHPHAQPRARHDPRPRARRRRPGALPRRRRGARPRAAAGLPAPVPLLRRAAQGGAGRAPAAHHRRDAASGRGASSPATPAGSTSCSTSAASSTPARSSRCAWATCATTISMCAPTARSRAGPRRPRRHRTRRVLVHARVLHDDQHPLQPAPLPRAAGGVPAPAPQNRVADFDGAVPRRAARLSPSAY